MIVDGVEYLLFMVSVFLINFIRLVLFWYLYYLVEYVSCGDSLELDYIKEGFFVFDFYLCFVEC